MSIAWKDLFPVFALLLLAGPAFAAYSADFFNTDGKPSIRYDSDRTEWTIENRGIRRSVRFDPSLGGLYPGPVVDLRSGREAGVRVISEGEVVLDTPSTAQPVDLAGWRMTSERPPEGWAAPGFDASGWTETVLPFKTDEGGRSWWFRADVPTGKLAPGKSYSLVLDNAVDDAAEVFVDGKSVSVLTAASQPWTKVVSIPIPAGAKTIGIRLDGGGRPNGLANVRVAEGGESRRLHLEKGWRLQGHDAKDGALSIRLRGTGENEGFDVTVVYRVFPGREPAVSKRLFVRNRSGAPLLLREAVLDRYASKGARPVAQTYTGSGVAVSAGGRGPGFATGVLHWQGRCFVDDGGRSVNALYAPRTSLADGQVTGTPWAVLEVYDGPPETGAFLLQLYAGSHVSKATPTTVPPLFSTWFGYYMEVDEALVRKLVPMAADLGVKVFSIDDGWQALADEKTWGYGDWYENRAKFPGGLASIADLVREHGMRFGMWSAPIMVNDNSEIIEKHPEWLVVQADGSRKALWGKTSAMCFSGDYAAQYTKALANKARDLRLGFVKLDGSLFVDGCTAEGHGHPRSFSEGSQVEAWETLVGALREASPGIIVDRGWEGEPGLTALQDTSWFGDWSTAFHPEREADPKWWYKNADIYRRALYTLAANRPPFTLSWETPCHIPTSPPDLDALEYHFTSIGAYISNVEIHGKLLDSTPEERALLRKWVRWNAENREWLAFAQPIASLGQPYDALDDKSVPHVDGVLHLRNALRGRYGYACLWNPSDKAETVEVEIRPADYFVKMDTAKVRATRHKDGKPVDLKRSADAVTLRIPMAPRSWEIVEFTQAG